MQYRVWLLGASGCAGREGVAAVTPDVAVGATADLALDEIRLEEFMRPVNEFHQLTDAELLARLVGIWRDIVACPESTPEQVRRAETMLALPWDRPHGEWTVTQLVTFRTEAMRPDSTL